MIHEEFGDMWNQPALGLEEFLVALRPYDTYWLTTHCMNGNPENAQALMKQKVSKEISGDIDRIQPTTWCILKTEALDFKSDFIWFDNEVTAEELKVLDGCRNGQSQVQVDLKTNPEQLIEITRDIL